MTSKNYVQSDSRIAGRGAVFAAHDVLGGISACPDSETAVRPVRSPKNKGPNTSYYAVPALL